MNAIPVYIYIYIFIYIYFKVCICATYRLHTKELCRYRSSKPKTFLQLLWMVFSSYIHIHYIYIYIYNFSEHYRLDFSWPEWCVVVNVVVVIVTENKWKELTGWSRSQWPYQRVCLPVNATLVRSCNKSRFATSNQVCQMVCFQTKNPNLGKFFRVLNWKMLIYIFYDHLVHCVFIWYSF
jgi:hypothetical protein